MGHALEPAHHTWLLPVVVLAGAAPIGLGWPAAEPMDSDLPREVDGIWHAAEALVGGELLGA